MQRKVNRSDSDYHYGKEKYKRNVYKMMLKCKQREVMSGDINDYSRYKDGIVYNEPCVLAGCRVNAVSSRQNRPDSIHQNFHVKLISGCIKQFRPSSIINLTFARNIRTARVLVASKSLKRSPKAGAAGGGGDWPPPARSLHHSIYMARHIKGAQPAAEAKQNRRRLSPLAFLQP